jgi:archaellum biogenesis ATPase FlaH
MSNAFTEGKKIATSLQTPYEKLKQLSATNRIKEMKMNLQNEFYVMDGLALDGQITLFYAKPNTGKTLIFLKLLIDGIEANKIKAYDILYINADDGYRGLCTKTEIAIEYGFEMIAPAEAGVSPADIIALLNEMSNTDDAKGKIIVLDTLKKFADMMSKRDQAELYMVLRRLVAKNATVIIAGHANKHLDKDGNLVYEGTSDTMNDVDCAYSIYLMTEPSGDVVVEFRREKSRGDNVYKISYGYKRDEGMSYMGLIKSVYKLNDNEAESATALGNQKLLQERFEPEILFITDALKTGELNQSSLLAKLKALDGEGIASEVSVRTVKSALQALTNVLWTSSRDKHNNAIVYKLTHKNIIKYADFKNGVIYHQVEG